MQHIWSTAKRRTARRAPPACNSTDIPADKSAASTLLGGRAQASRPSPCSHRSPSRASLAPSDDRSRPGGGDGGRVPRMPVSSARVPVPQRPSLRFPCPVRRALRRPRPVKREGERQVRHLASFFAPGSAVARYPNRPYRAGVEATPSAVVVLDSIEPARQGGTGATRRPGTRLRSGRRARGGSRAPCRGHSDRRARPWPLGRAGRRRPAAPARRRTSRSRRGR